jgi:hypothetical protein
MFRGVPGEGGVKVCVCWKVGPRVGEMSGVAGNSTGVGRFISGTGRSLVIVVRARTNQDLLIHVSK